MSDIDVHSLKPINRASSEVKKRTPFIRSTPTIALKGGRIFRFSAAMCHLAKIYKDKYIHFFNPSGKIWYFIVNDDPTGWPVHPDGRDAAGASTSSSAVFQMFRETVKCGPTDKFHVQKTSSKYRDADLYEILTGLPIKKEPKKDGKK